MGAGCWRVIGGGYDGALPVRIRALQYCGFRFPTRPTDGRQWRGSSVGLHPDLSSCQVAERTHSRYGRSGSSSKTETTTRGCQVFQTRRVDRPIRPEISVRAISGTFSLPRLEPSATLQPIGTWEGMCRELSVTGVEFDDFWFESARRGIACFFGWTGAVRATGLIVIDNKRILHLEARGVGDWRLASPEVDPIALEVWRMFWNAFNNHRYTSRRH